MFLNLYFLWLLKHCLLLFFCFSMGFPAKIALSNLTIDH
jgi:hypothetical protein